MLYCPPKTLTNNTLDHQDTYVLLSEHDTYFVEYLLGELVISDHISEAAIFKCRDQAIKFKQYLYKHCKMSFSVNTFIQ